MLTVIDILRDNVPFLIAASILVIWLVFFVVYKVLQKAVRQEGPQPLIPSQPPPEPSAQAAGAPRVAVQQAPTELRPAFERGVERLKAKAPGRDYRYHLPWFLMLNEDGQDDALLPSSLPRALASEDPIRMEDAGRQPLRWWFFDAAVVLTVGRDFLIRSDRDVATQNRWLTLLRLIRKARPERPLDGLILTVPAVELVRAASGGAEAAAPLLEKADALRATLQALPEKIGMRLPVYVLVTGCEDIDGFDALVSALPDSSRQQIFGWSSPYPLADTFSARWVEEAFREVGRDLTHIQFQTFAEHGDLAGNDDLFVFPERFSRLQGPLEDYLNRVFKRSVYYETFQVRGFYFAGRPSVSAERRRQEALEAKQGSDVLPRPTHGRSRWEEAPKTLFVHDLFERKIFPEAGLAEPIERFRAPVNRTVMALKAAVALVILFMGIATFYSYPRLQQDRDAYRVLLRDVRTEVADGRKTADELASDTYRTAVIDLRDNTQKLLYGMQNIRGRWFGSYVMPSSWFDSLPDEIVDAMVFAYRYVILQSLNLGLQLKTETLVDDRDNVDLATYIAQVRELEENAANYEVLRQGGEGDLALLRRTVTYLEFADLDGLREDFDRNEIFRTALGRARLDEPFPYIQYSAAFHDNFHAKLSALYETEFDLNSLIHDVRILTKTLTAKEENLPTRYEELQLLLGDIQRLKQSAANTDNFWLSAPQYDPEKRFPGVTPYFRQSRFLNPADDPVVQAEGISREAALLITTFQTRGPLRFSESQVFLQQARSELTGRIMTEPATSGQWAVATGVNDFESWLGQMLHLAQGWQERDPDFEFVTPIRWDTTYLDEAIEVFKSYEKVADAAPLATPGGSDPAVERLEGRMVTLLSRAHRARTASLRSGQGTADDYIREIESFVAAAQPLTQVLQNLDAAGLQDTYGRLSGLIGQQTQRILRHLDALLAQENLYVPREEGFGWWSGSEAVSFAAFNVDSPIERSGYLQSQRQRVAFLARQYAQPTINLLLNTASLGGRSNNPSVERWSTILRQLDNYDKKDVNSSVLALENYIDNEMDKVTPAGCGTATVFSTTEEDATDFFLGKRNGLERRLQARCAELQSLYGVTRYERIADFFNGKLAGRFPFSPSLSEMRESKAAFQEASPTDLRDFLRLFEAEGVPTLAFLEQNPSVAEGTGEAVQFLRQVEQVRTFFQSVIEETSAGPEPVLDFEVLFRENLDQRGAEREVCGVNQIIEWNLSVGRQEFSYPDPTAQEGEEGETAALKGRWTFADPIELTLRWARNAPCRPIQDPSLVGFSVDSTTRTAILQYRNPWSVFAMVRENPSIAPDFPETRAHPEILKLSVPVLPAQQRSGIGAEQDREWKTNAFLRFLLRPPGKPDQELAVPAFPIRAPALRSNMSQGRAGRERGE